MVCVLGWLVLVPTSAAQLTWREIGPPERVIVPPLSAMRVSMDILVNGQPVRTVSHHGRLYLPVARYGAEYQIRVTNHGPRRVVAIVSVDGLSILNGQPARDSHPGYVVAAHSSVVIPGWRRDMNRVAAFTFEEREQSYAYRLGYPGNIGVIGLVAFEEWTREPPRPLLERREGADFLRAAPVREPAGDLRSGTGWGRDLESHIYYVSFVRSANRRTITMYYDTAHNLRRLGVPVDGPWPTPFPADPEFCPPPPVR
jgi:hypothetical protein